MPATTVVNYKLDAFDVCVMRPSKWGNPFRIGHDGTREQVVEKYEKYIRARPDLMADLHELRGKRLGCCCKPKACHGDILVKLIEETCPRGERDIILGFEPRVAGASPAEGTT
jgi:hypothetical protein